MDDTKNRRNVVIGLTLAGLLITAGLAGCEQDVSVDTKEKAPAVETKSEPAAGEAMQDETMQDMSAADEATQDMPAADEATQDMPAADEAK